jgi:integrase/recombinase XerD
MTIAKLSDLLQSFFTDRLMAQKRASSHTIASYRDTFRLLLLFAEKRLKKMPTEMMLNDLEAPFICAFLDHLEKDRKMGARSRNQRLAAIRSFFHYAAFETPELSTLIDRVLAIPSKRFDRALVEFLTTSEIEALLKAPARETWLGRRDHALLTLAIQTGLRVSELVGLCRDQITLTTGPHVRCLGKGRKERCTPLTHQTVMILKGWLKELGPKAALVFPNSRGGQLGPDGVQYLLKKYASIAQKSCPSLGRKKLSPHVLRHTTAMQLLQAGVDRSVIALWLGHESVETTQIYLQANLKMKEEILKKTAPLNTRSTRFRAGDRLLAFLQGL